MIRRTFKAIMPTFKKGDNKGERLPIIENQKNKSKLSAPHSPGRSWGQGRRANKCAGDVTTAVDGENTSNMS